MPKKLEGTYTPRSIAIKPGVVNLSLSTSIAILLFSASFSAHAGFLDAIRNQDTFHPYVSQSVTYDDNLYRLPESLKLSNFSRSDTIFQTAVGLNIDWKVSRQHFIFNLGINDNNFDQHTNLNYIGTDIQARWNWALGNHLSGDMGYTNSLTLGSFTDQQNTQIKNQRTQERLFFNAKWLFHPSWQMGVGASTNNYDYGDQSQRQSNREDTAFEVSLQYQSSSTSKVGLKLRESEYTYPFRSPSFNYDNGYSQHDLMVTLDWAYSAKTRFYGQLGAVKKEGHNFSTGDFLSFSGQGTLTWYPTSKTKLDFSVWRNVNNYEDFFIDFTSNTGFFPTSYAINQGISVEASWVPSAKTMLSGKLSHEARDFISNRNSQSTFSDTTEKARLTFTYSPISKLNLSANISGEKRDSNLPYGISPVINRSYNDVSIGLSVAFEL